MPLPTLPLPTTVAPGDPGHAALHNNVNSVGNYLISDTQTQNKVLAAPSGANGAGAFRLLTAADIPILTSAKISDFTAAVNAILGASPTIVTPTIASFANAQHNHQNAAGGGSLDAAAIGSGTLANARVSFAAPDSIGSTTPNTGAFSTLHANGTTALTVPDGTSDILDLKYNSIGQAGYLQTWQDSDASLLMSFYKSSGGATLIVGRDADTTPQIQFRGAAGAANQGVSMQWFRGGVSQWQYGVDGNNTTGANSFFWFTPVSPSGYRMGLSLAGLLSLFPMDAVTNANLAGLLVSRKISSGTPAANFGSDVTGALQSSTTANRSASRWRWYWNTATDASRKAYSIWSAFDTAERDAIGVGADGSNPLIGFYNKSTTPIAQAQLSTGASHTVDDVITALQNLGLVKQ